MDELFLRLQTELAGEYSIERELGRGGMGIVYLAREVRLAREVAIKVLPPELAATPGLRGQFLREAQTAARLSHPNIVPIHRVDEAGGFVYFVMAFVNGETLAERVRTRGPLAPHLAARILREVAWALTYAHSAGIIHRDIKAENILLERGTDRALVTDFGIAGAAHADARTTDGLVAGSAHYASPEQIAGQPLDAASDIYSLGVTGFLALTGRLPFDAATSREVVAMHLNARPPNVTSLAPATPAKLSQIIERCLAKRAEHRFSTAAAFAEAVEQAVEPPREIPAPLRVWLNQTNQLGRLQAVGTVYLSLGIAFPLALLARSPLLGVLGFTGALGGILVAPAAFRARRLLHAGYDLSDVRMALREYWLRRREEAAIELSADRVTGGTSRSVVAFAGSAVVTVGMMAYGTAVHTLTPTLGIVGLMSAAFTVGAGVLSLGDSIRRRRLPRLGSEQIKFYDGKWAERLFRLAGVGLRRKTSSAAFPQLTEVALGRATDALYDALPKPMRRQLKALPDAVKRLETDARKLREEIDRLDSSIAQLDGDARALPSAIVDSSHEANIRSDRDRLRADLRALRERASERLASTVAALENIRLDLMRLQLGDGRVESVTASLEAAQAAASQLGDFVDATREVEAHLSRLPSSASRLNGE